MIISGDDGQVWSCSSLPGQCEGFQGEADRWNQKKLQKDKDKDF